MPATHIRKQIREALATAVTGLSTTGSRVYQSRIYPLGDSKLPCLLVNTDDEQIEAISVHAPATLERTLDVTVRAVAKAVSDLDDTLDQIVLEVETALGGSNPLGSLAKLVGLQSVRVEFDGDNEKPVGLATMNYRVMYYTASNAPGTAL